LAAIMTVVAVTGAGVVATVTLGDGGTGASVAVQPTPVSPTRTIPSRSPRAVPPTTPPSPTTASPIPSPPTTPPRPAVTSSTSTPTRSTALGPGIVPPITRSAGIDVLAPRRIAAPVGLVIPTLGIDGQVAPTGVNERAELDVPADARTLVWYRFGPSPGEVGSAVIAGHLDWKGALGTFHALERTPIGEHITVRYDDDSQRTFTVTDVALVDKPSVAVNGTFAGDGSSVLRLVTCGGEFDDDVDSYYSNVVVTAEVAD